MRDLKLKGQKYVDLLSDSGFKAVFADEANKDIVIDFLNVVFDGERVVRDIEHIRGELPGKTMSSKGVRFDLVCRDVDGTSFVVEMQRSHNVGDFFYRSVYYGSKVYEIHQSLGSDSYYSPPVYVIGIMETMLEHERLMGEHEVVSYYQFMEKARGTVAPSTISCIFVQLGNFSLSESECETDFERWCFTMKRISELDSLPSVFSEGFGRLYDACEIAQFDQVKRLDYEKNMMTERDYNHDMYFSREEGKAEGYAEAVRAFKESGVDMVTICKATGLTEEQVRAL